MNKGLPWSIGKRCSCNRCAESFAYSFLITFLSLILILGFLWPFPGGKSEAQEMVQQSFVSSIDFSSLIAAFSWFYILSPGGLISRFFDSNRHHFRRGRISQDGK
ncbi:MAG: hypothetical protein R2784_16755 [Saprospiraceae bacterium]